MKVELYSPDISCEGCAQAIQKILKEVAGVNELKVEVEPQRILLNFDESIVSLQQIRERLSQAGYDTELKD